MKIFFLENSDIIFNGDSLNSNSIGGSERTLINISTELAKFNYDVFVFNNPTNEKIISNVKWHHIKSIKNFDNPDISIAMSDSNLLNLVKCPKKFVWSHSVETIEKFIRKKQLLPFLKNKPVVLLEGNYHYKKRSLFTSLFGKYILKLAPDYDFINAKIDLEYIPNNNAIFTTRPDRNLSFLLECWHKIFSQTSNAKLYINPPYKLSQSDISRNVLLRKLSTKNELIIDLLQSKVMLVPGHKGEVFCLAAEEAKALCVPIVTMGFGSLSERVDHLKTGYIAKTKSEFINFAIDILNNNKTYLELKKNLMKIRGIRTYENVASDLIKIIDK